MSVCVSVCVCKSVCVYMRVHARVYTDENLNYNNLKPDLILTLLKRLVWVPLIKPLFGNLLPNLCDYLL